MIFLKYLKKIREKMLETHNENRKEKEEQIKQKHLSMR